MKTESQCKCGQKFFIEDNARSCRVDKKRVWYSDEPDEGWCVHRCKTCGELVSETVPGAEYGPERFHRSQPQPECNLLLRGK